MSIEHGFIPRLQDGTTKINATVQSGSWVSEPLFVAEWNSISASHTCPGTGSPVGVLSIEASNDKEVYEYGVSDANLLNWMTLTDASGNASVSISTTEPTMIMYPKITVRWVRIRYARTSGTITSTLTIQDKREGNL